VVLLQGAADDRIISTSTVKNWEATIQYEGMFKRNLGKELAGPLDVGVAYGWRYGLCLLTCHAASVSLSPFPKSKSLDNCKIPLVSSKKVLYTVSGNETRTPFRDRTEASGGHSQYDRYAARYCDLIWNPVTRDFRPGRRQRSGLSLLRGIAGRSSLWPGTIRSPVRFGVPRPSLMDDWPKRPKCGYSRPDDARERADCPGLFFASKIIRSGTRVCRGWHEVPQRSRCQAAVGL
jgi:hypothetical protein